MRKILLYIPLLCMLLNSCQDDDAANHETATITDGEFVKNFGSQVSRDFIGQIVDVENHPVQTATVKIGASSVQTDANGIFIINDAGVYERFAYITATKAGFVAGSRSLVPTTGKNNIKIMLLPVAIMQTIPSGTTSEVSIYSGTKVVFDGAFEDESGAAYTGNVNVSMFHLTPSDENLNSLMPGMLYAKDEAGAQKVLETFGMLHVELLGSAGQKLQPAAGHMAEITMRIDDDQMATAPATIPLWHFDDANGYWKQEGSATKQGNKYVGKVSHFSWWNCDAPFPTIRLSARVVDANGNPIPNVLITLERSATAYTTSGSTDENGRVSGLIPANETLVLKAYMNGACEGLALISMTVGPFAADAVLADIVLQNSAVESVTINGNLLKCDQSNVQNGYVILSSNHQTGTNIVAVTDGSFSFNILKCGTDNNFTLRGFDYMSQQTTGLISFNYTSPVTHVGNILACTAVTEFISYQIDNNPAVLKLDGYGYFGINLVGENFIYIQAGSVDFDRIYVGGPASAPGTYTTNDGFYVSSESLRIDEYIVNDVQFNVNAIGNVGEYIDITFNGTYTDSLAVHTVTGMARAIRSSTKR